VAQTALVESSDWAATNQRMTTPFITVGTSTGTLNTYSFLANVLAQTDTRGIATGSSAIQSVRYHPTLPILAVGRLAVSTSNSLYTYSLTTTGALVQVSSVSPISAGVGDSVSLAWHPSGNYLAVGVNNSTSATDIFVYSVNNAGVITTPALASVSLTPVRAASREALSWDPSGTYLAVGVATNTLNSEFLICTFSASGLFLEVTAGAFFGITVNSVDWNQTFTNIVAVGLNTPFSGASVIAYNYNSSTAVLTQNATITNISVAIRALHWNPAGGACLAVGSSLTSGNGLSTYLYNNSAGSFIQTGVQESGDNVMTARWNRNGTYLSAGGSTDALSIYGDVNGASYTFNNLEIILNSSVSLYNSFLVFSGSSTLNGKGNVLDLTDTSTIVLASGSSLLCKNITIKGLHDGNFYAVDNTGVFYFDRTQLWLDGHYTFSQGAFVVEFGNTLISGTSVFAYESAITSTIATESHLIIDQNVTFSYVPLNSSPNLIVLHDSLSQLILQRSSLFVGIQGLNLLKGMLAIIGQSYIYGDGTTPSTGIIFGDNASSSNNCVLNINAGRLDFLRGFIGYQNI
jgi:hypothetical protein